MRIFIYKSVFVAVLFFIVFSITFGQVKEEINKKVSELTSGEYVEKIKDEIREGMRNAIEKDDYINDNDAELIRKFLLKIESEINR